MFRYYLVDLGTKANQRQQRINALRSILPNGPTRQEARAMFHYATSTDDRWLLGDAWTDDAEHGQLIAMGYVTYMGEKQANGMAPQAVYEYMAANPALWYPDVGD